MSMPPPAPRPPQQRGTGPFNDAELRALYSIHASTPSSELVAALQEHLSDVKPNRVFAVVPLLHAATTEIFVRGSFGSTPTNQPREACGSHTWAGYTCS